MREFLQTVPWFIPVFALALALGMLLGGPIGARLGVGRRVAWGLVAAVGLIVAATVTPHRDALDHGAVGAATCDLSRIGFARLSEYFSGGEAGLNIVLFIPLGVVVALARRAPSGAWIVLAAIVLPFVIEGVQLLVHGLGRACESGDLVDNLAGLGIGLVLGVGVAAAVPRRSV